MKKIVILSLGAAMLLSSCGAGNENAASGGFIGAQLGSILGSAIGGISGGPRGSDLGTIVGMAGGAVAGAAIGSVADKANQREYDEYKSQCRMQTAGYGAGAAATDDAANAQSSGFDPNNGGDDVIDFDGGNASHDSSPVEAQGTPSGNAAPQDELHFGSPSGMHIDGLPDSRPLLEVRSVRFVDSDGDMTLRRGEIAKIVVEIYNNSSSFIYGVQPIVAETTGNKHVQVSSPILVEKMAPDKGIRYTAMVRADKRLKDGAVKFLVYAKESAGQRTSAKRELSVETCK